MGYIDLHCDTLMQFAKQTNQNSLLMSDKQVDLIKLKKGGADAQFFAIFPPGPEFYKWQKIQPIPTEEYISRLYSAFLEELANNSDYIRFAGSYTDYVENKKKGLISAFLTLEDGKFIDGKIEKLQQLHNDGFRLVTLTWNYENCFGFPNSDNREIMHKGLKKFGIEAVERMNDMGMIIDVSHLSDGGFYDVAKHSKKPFTASHSNARSVCSHPRNLTDEMIKIIADKGGIIGINFGPDFVDEKPIDKKSTIKGIIRHMKYMKKIGGIECIAIGTDFDGIMGTQQIKDASDIPLLIEALQKEGFQQSEIEKITYENAERFLKEVI